MMSLASIQYLNDEATTKAAKKHKKPYVPYNAEEVQAYGTSGNKFPAPLLGDYVAPGWELVESLFVDKTEIDMSGPAMSLSELKKYIITHLPESYGYGLSDEGEFQIYIKVYKKISKKY